MPFLPGFNMLPMHRRDLQLYPDISCTTLCGQGQGFPGVSGVAMHSQRGFEQVPECYPLCVDLLFPHTSRNKALTSEDLTTKRYRYKI